MAKAEKGAGAVAPRIFAIYRESLNARPRLTNAVVSMTIALTADISAQSMEFVRGNGLHSFVWDFERTRALCLTSALYNGLILTNWFMFLSWLFPRADLKAAFAKLALSQSLLQPFVYVPFFFLVHGLLLGQRLHQIGTELTTNYFALLFRLWTLFMPSRLLMFIIVPVKYQVLWDSVVSFLWQVVLSLFESKHGRMLELNGGGLITEAMEFEGFGYLVARPEGAQFLPREP